MWASRIYSRGGLDFRRSHFACRLRDVVALLCKRMYEVAGKQSNYDCVTEDPWQWHISLSGLFSGCDVVRKSRVSFANDVYNYKNRVASIDGRDGSLPSSIGNILDEDFRGDSWKSEEPSDENCERNQRQDCWRKIRGRERRISI